MMLAQFQSLYPEGSLISELVQIYHGKYIVRASVQIEGVIRATGMAAAETLEDAEDQARSRALMVLGITSTPQESQKFAPEQIKPFKPTFAPTSGLNESADSAAINSFPQTEATLPLAANNDTTRQDLSEGFLPASTPDVPFDTTRQDLSEGFPSLSTPDVPFDTTRQDLSEGFPSLSTPDVPFETTRQDLSEGFLPASTPDVPFDDESENFGIISGNKAENNQFSKLSASNVTPFPLRSYSRQEDVGTETATGKRKKKTEPVDHSEAIAKIDAEMERLGWNKDQGREHLIKTYGKRARSLLNDEELLGFLRYLESQPTPPDPLAGF